MWLRVKHGPIGKRAILSLCDQIVASAGNLALTVFVARAASTGGFGAFSVASSLVLLLLGINRATSTDPLLVQTSGRRGQSAVQSCRDAISANLFVGTLIGAAVAAIALVFDVGPARPVLLAFAVIAPLLSLQDATRYVAIAYRGPGLALLNDLLWSVAGVAAFLVLTRFHEEAPWQYLAAWGLTSLLGAAVTFFALPPVRRFRLSPSWLSQQRSLGRPFLLRFLAETGTSQSALLLVAVVGGLSAIAGIRVVITLFGPVTVIFAGMQLLLLPEFSSPGRVGKENVVRFSRVVSVGLAVTAGLCGFVLTLVPDELGRAAFGTAWVGGKAAIGPYTVAIVCAGLVAAPSCALRARGHARKALRVAVTQMPIVLVAPVLGAYLDGGYGAAWGIAIGSMVSATLWWITMLRYQRAGLNPTMPETLASS
jgi:O-antigen/teichoic acid export membrane protein